VEFILLALSVPFFYVLGVIQLVSWFRKKDDLDKKVFEKIKKEAKTSPTKTLREFYNENKEKHEIYIPQPEKSIAEPPEKVADKIAKSILQQDTGTLWNNWYSENSINLLLYLGAFLIVASASIFVGFQWDTLSGVVKSIVLTLLTLSFFGSGLWFHSIPKIKNAGMTFIGISALLIPICGTGWYNFVLKDMGVTGGAVWLLTSLVSLILYSYLAQKFKNSFFTYSASLATISLALSNILECHLR